MGKKNVNKGDSAVEAAHSTRKGPEGGILFSSGDMILEATRQQARLNHVTKPWTREGWERARPWVLEQRQKLETQGWTPVDGARTELFVLRKNAPHGADTEDGFLYVRIPKKFIDFNRSGKPDQSEAGDESVLGEGKKGRRISSRRKELSYDLSNPDIWKIKIDGEAENSEVEANVQLDVIEPLENLFYLTMTLQPGLARLMATRKEVVQNGTRESDTRDDPDGQTIRHRAMIAAEEGYMRTMAPAYWYRRNETWLRKILTDPAFEACLRAAEDPVRATEHTIKDVREKVWEEKVKVDEKTLGADGKPKKVKKAPRFNAIAAASCLGTAAA